MLQRPLCSVNFHLPTLINPFELALFSHELRMQLDKSMRKSIKVKFVFYSLAKNRTAYRGTVRASDNWLSFDENQEPIERLQKLYFDHFGSINHCLSADVFNGLQLILCSLFYMAYEETRALLAM